MFVRRGIFWRLDLPPPPPHQTYQCAPVLILIHIYQLSVITSRYHGANLICYLCLTQGRRDREQGGMGKTLQVFSNFVEGGAKPSAPSPSSLPSRKKPNALALVSRCYGKCLNQYCESALIVYGSGSTNFDECRSGSEYSPDPF